MRHGLALLIALTLPAAAHARDLMLPAADGFVLGHQQTQGQNAILELIPKGQTLTNFTKMVTMQRFAAMAVPSDTFVAQFAKRYMASCPGAKAVAQPMGKAAGIRIDCPRHPKTGKNETVLARAINDGPGLYLVQVAFRYMPMPNETLWARDYLGSVGFKP